MQYTTTALTSKEVDKFSSSVSICPKRLCFIVLEQGSTHGIMNTLLCSPSMESELTRRYGVWVKAVIECIPPKAAYSLIIKKASISTFLGQWLQESPFHYCPIITFQYLHSFTSLFTGMVSEWCCQWPMSELYKPISWCTKPFRAHSAPLMSVRPVSCCSLKARY